MSFSERGRVIPQYSHRNARELLVQRYGLVYEVMASEVHILAFVQGARDPTRSEFES
jgi:plasmid stabilization system protein ParE